MIKLLIFDLDGTLIDSAPDIIQVANIMRARRHEPPASKEDVIEAIGNGAKVTVEKLFPEAKSNPEALEALQKEYIEVSAQHLLEKTTMVKGVEDFLSGWKENIAIVTNKDQKLADETVRRLPLHKFKWMKVFGANSLPKRKPDPMPLLEAVKVAGCKKSEAVMIGDGTADMEAARAAGIHSVGIRFGYSKPEDMAKYQPTAWLDAYADLSGVLEKIAKLPDRTLPSEAGSV